MDRTMALPAQSFSSLRRRSLLLGMGSAALIAGAAFGVDAAQEPAAPSADFLSVSRFVTSSAIDDMAAAGRAWQQLVALDAGFPGAIDRLATAIGKAGLRTMADFQASPLAANADLVKTVTTVTSAWYLGYTGEAVSHRSKDDTGFVTFVGALMWRPTIAETVIPTFALGATDYWIEPPAGTPEPKGPKRQPAWTGSATSSDHLKA